MVKSGNHKKQCKRGGNESPSSSRMFLLLGSVAVLVAAFAIRRIFTRSESDLPPIEACVRWVLREGGEMNNVDIAEVGGDRGRGLIARAPIQSGEVLIHVPAKLVISEKTVSYEAISASKKVFGGHAEVPRNLQANIALLLGLLQERKLGHQSIFGPYIKTLPNETAQNLPFWDETLRKTVRPLHEAEVAHASFLESLPMLLERNPPKAEDIKWAAAMAHSRVFTKDGVQAMVPLFDMANHDADGGNAQLRCGYDEQRLGNGCQIISSKAISTGEEVTVFYGNKSNLQMLSTYGFDTGASNPFSAAGAPLGLKRTQNLRFDSFMETIAGDEEIRKRCIEIADELSGSLTAGTGRYLAQQAALEPKGSIKARVMAALRRELKSLEECASLKPQT